MKLTLTQRKPEVPGVESFIFEPASPISWKAGQFLHAVLHHEPTDDRGSDRWFTIAAAPSEDHVMITTRHAAEKGSTFKKALFGLKVGDAIEVSDVDGDFIIGDPARQCVFIAGGIGITPFRSILKEADSAGVRLKATLLYANRDQDVPYRDELEAFARKNPDLRIRYHIGEQIDEAAIRAAGRELHAPMYYVSGPEPMVESFGALLRSMGIAPADIKQDWFPGYPAE